MLYYKHLDRTLNENKKHMKAYSKEPRFQCVIGISNKKLVACLDKSCPLLLFYVYHFWETLKSSNSGPASAFVGVPVVARIGIWSWMLTYLLSLLFVNVCRNTCVNRL